MVSRSDVATAFEIVLEEIEAVVDDLNRTGAGVLVKGDYDAAKGVIETATRLTDFRTRVRALQREWATLLSEAPSASRATKRVKGRLRKGLRTPEDAFRRPILETLVEFGGTGNINAVLDRVGERMQKVLNDYDMTPVPSDPNIPRWRNNAQWCRNTLATEGLLNRDSPRGTWEITSDGRAYLDHKMQADRHKNDLGQRSQGEY